jgi:hypothetical protein
MKKQFFVIMVLFFFCGCARLQEPFKAVWGSSTKALEDNRANATMKTYECFPGACFDKVIEVVQGAEKSKATTAQKVGLSGELLPDSEFKVFIKDRKKNCIVVMGVPGSVDTTEVGIFITPLQLKEARVEVVSLSSVAQQTVSNLIFQELDKAFSQIVEIPL